MKTAQLDSFKDFHNVTKGYNIYVSNNQLDLFKKYYEILLDWGKRINLVSRAAINRGSTDILEKHFLDSILFLPEIESLVFNSLISILDIGSGGGFPAIPLAIMKPNWHFTLCESVKKKTNFLEHIVKELGLKNVEIINGRVETLHVTSLRFDLITARAVAKLDELIKYSMPLLKKDGYLIAYKAKNIDDEIKNIKNLKIFSKEISSVERKLVVLTHPDIP